MRALAAVLVLLAGCAGPKDQSDWERENIRATQQIDEQLPRLPPPPRRGPLLEFPVSGSPVRFFVDGSSLEPGQDGVVRYVLVARTAGGVDNVSFEGIRCATGESRQYAVGHPDGKWSARAGDWRPALPWQRVLGREYFCAQSVPIRDRGEGVRALQEGGHPFSRGFSGDRFRDSRQ